MILNILIWPKAGNFRSKVNIKYWPIGNNFQSFLSNSFFFVTAASILLSSKELQQQINIEHVLRISRDLKDLRTYYRKISVTAYDNNRKIAAKYFAKIFQHLRYRLNSCTLVMSNMSFWRFDVWIVIPCFVFRQMTIFNCLFGVRILW